jgi:Ca-activated chloride channel family protein
MRTSGVAQVNKVVFCAALLCVLALLTVPHAGRLIAQVPTGAPTILGTGSLNAVDPDGKPLGTCPLKHTRVQAEISGFVARVNVKQTFGNPFKERIEAVYTFPLSQQGAVDDMLMKVGERVIRGEIKRREEARRIYEDAKARGEVASLLDQERPNIFTQSVANIMPGEEVEITIRYVELLQFETGAFTFSFPTVVGPRFIPGSATGKSGTGTVPDTVQVPDASKITPPVTPKGTRAGHDIDITVTVDAGMNIRQISSALHDVEIAREGDNRAVVKLKNKEEIPNRDFVLKYEVAGDSLKSGYLAHRAGKDGYLTLILLPPKRPTAEQISPKEMIFVIDRSGSQRGAPLQKAKETMIHILENMNPEDTFQVIDFSDKVNILFDEPQKISDEMLTRAKSYIATLSGNGGTWMEPAVEAACSIPADANRLRIVVFMTDGYVGNDFQILGMVKKLRGNSRWFPFGAGNSVNRFLLDNMAKLGGGEVEYVLLNSSGAKVAAKFYSRISTPVLTDVKVEFVGGDVAEVYPQHVSDVWEQRPLYICARYKTPGKATATLRGFAGGKPYEEKLTLDLPELERANSSVASIWARAKVDCLMEGDYLLGAQGRTGVNAELKEEIIGVALEHRIMTQYTSFVAVEEAVVTIDGQPMRIVVPVEMPEGVSYEGVFGDLNEKSLRRWKGKGRGHGRISTGGNKLETESKDRGEGEPGEFFDRMTPEEQDKYISETRLATGLRDLIKKMAAEDKNGSFTAGNIEVKDGKVVVQIYLKDQGDAVLKKLKDMGVEILFKATATKMVIARAQIDKLLEIAKLDVVKFIDLNFEETGDKKSELRGVDVEKVK